MKRFTLIAAVALVVTACGSSDTADTSTTVAATEASTTTQGETTTTTAAPTTTEAPTTTAAETTTTTEAETTTTAAATTSLTGLAITEVVFGSHTTITNNTDAEVNLSGWWLCNRPAYVPLDGTLAPGESVQISADELVGLAAEAGEVGLYTDGNFGSSSDMADYVAWGDGGGRESVAVGAGLWAADAAAPNDGSGIVRVADPSAADSWESS